MSLYPLPALLSPFSRTFINKNNTNNRRSPSPCPFPALLTLFPVIAFLDQEATNYVNEEAIDAITEAAMGAIIGPRIPLSCFFISCFTVSIAPSINRSDFSGDFTILIISPYLHLK